MGEFAFERYEFGFVRYALAFDPSKSPHYKVVCVTNFNDHVRICGFDTTVGIWCGSFDHYDGGHHEIDIYSSETGKWKHLDTPFFPSPSDEGANHDCKEMAMHFDYRSRKGIVYCNAAVHWIRGSREARLPFCTFGDGRNEFIRNESDVLHYFDVGEERLLLASATPPVPLVVKKIPLISSPSPHYSFKSPSEYPRLARRYFGECCGRLYLIETYQHCSTEFEVMEMEKDYSGWFVKYNVDLSPVLTALPRQDWNAFVILCLSQEEETSLERHDEVEDSSTVLLLHIPSKVISYNLRNKTFKTSVELANKELFLGFENRREDDVNYPYVKSSACV
ncbi:F-box protein At5g07610-like [Rosa chinensis]|uniref:F-box protein At5g07610-like n=1 Tax=Rosa chinensis TaxID=74649 RepID=UPI001AD91B8C|nr:F-box protein At5g07610-like [Rosa chinensis]